MTAAILIAVVIVVIVVTTVIVCMAGHRLKIGFPAVINLGLATSLI